MLLFLKEQIAKLLDNGKASCESPDGLDHVPVVKLFTPDAQATWLLSEIMPHEPDIAFGLCDLGMGCPELGYVSIAELTALRGTLGLPVERDRHVTFKHPLTWYAARASEAGRIVLDHEGERMTAKAAAASPAAIPSL